MSKNISTRAARKVLRSMTIVTSSEDLVAAMIEEDRKIKALRVARPHGRAVRPSRKRARARGSRLPKGYHPRRKSTGTEVKVAGKRLWIPGK